ncbi:MAG: S9 family peptidase [Thermoanaerobaculia bacterium]
MKVTSNVVPSLVLLLLLVCGSVAFAAESAPEEKTEPRLLEVDDYFRIGQVADPQMSPDGGWVAYTVTTYDLEEDKSNTRVWMVPSVGGEARPLTGEKVSSSRPRWSPDGKYLAFLSARDESTSEVWTLFREGGEGIQLTDTPQSVNSFEWAPDSKRMVLVLKDPKPEELEAHEKGEDYEKKTPPPWVVTRQQFKLDYVGYLDSRRDHLYVFDLATKKTTQITSGDFDDSQPDWSPDGTQIAFTSNRTENPDANYNSDIWVVSASNTDKGAQLTQVTANPGADASPSWSSDGKLIAHTSNLETEARSLYGTAHLAVSSATGGESKVLTEDLDRMVFQPRFSPGDQAIYFLLEDSGEQNLARVSAEGGAVERLIQGPRVVGGFDFGPEGAIAVRVSDPQLPYEIFLFQNGKLEQRSQTNAELLSGLQLGQVEKVQFQSPDGTPIESFVIKPPGFEEGVRYPTILRIHGGPQAQYDYGFYFEQQIFAANGYLVVMPNPRGSTGYGQDFCLGIWQAWGEPDYEDVMAAVDSVIERGWADPDRLAVSGWSYGGMLTNHVITKTDRFKAAATGASATLYVVNYGHDQYQRWWEYELGVPWKPENRELWEKLSPYNRIESVVTPTLILGGKEDWNVPIINSEQLFLALKKLGVPTELVVYPGEYHGIDKPTHLKDLYERYVAWFGEYLKGEERQIGKAAE